MKKRFDKLPGLIVAIFRDGEQSIARGDDDLRAEDHIYVLMPEEELKNFRKFVHPESERVEKVVIAPEVIAEFRTKAADPIRDAWIADMEAQGIPGQELYDLVMKTLDDAKSGS